VTVLSRQAVGACLVAGPALWLSRAVFDRVGQGAGTRIAFLPSWPELVGLVVLVALAMLVAQAITERASGVRPARSALPPGMFAPSFLLAALVLPYLPWLADVVPSIDALAGPGRWWIWAIALGQIVWLTVTWLIETRGVATAWRPPLLVFLASATIFLASAWRLVPGPVYPGGDEPHYLVITQSLLTDHDLAIENNHARGDYRAYYASPLKPDYRVTGPGRTIYSIHPIGISVIIAPAFAVGGYRGAIILVALLSSVAMALQWRWVCDVTASSGAATVGWLAVATSAPFVLHSFSIYPECAAALALMVAVGWGWSKMSPASLAIQGAALGTLPWLSTKYAPMSGVLLVLIAARSWQSRAAWETRPTDGGADQPPPRLRRSAKASAKAEAPPPQATRATRATTSLLALVTPYVLSCVCWLAWFWWLWGTPSPTAPYGASHQMSLESLKAGFPGLFADQEYGAFATAPALALSAIGWWRLWRRDAEGRWLVAFTALPLLSLAAITGAFALWWGGSAPPGRELVAALPLLGVPIAWLWKDTAARPAQRAVIETLILVGIVITATFVLARSGLLIANGRDGTAELLEYLEPRRQLAAVLPSFIAFRSQVAVPLAVSAIWIAVAAVVWALCRRLTLRTAGSVRLLVSAVGVGASTVAALLAPAIVGRRSMAPLPVEARVETPSLSGYDATSRPLALEFTPWRITTPADAIRAVRFDATPGLRRSAQPVRVLLNARLALPAGTYQIRIDPATGETLAGEVALQIGRTGPPAVSWPVNIAAGASWSETFALDVDASFVGVRAAEDFERRVGRLEIAPISVIGRGERLRRPTVLAAARYGATRVYFHDDHTWPEADGFWVRGAITTDLTVGLQQAARPAGVRLRMHGGATGTAVRLATPAWSTRIVLTPGKTEDVFVPAREGQLLLALAVTPESGFVPAEHGGAINDRRLLGCWIAVVP
jgi:hypothetical protein